MTSSPRAELANLPVKRRNNPHNTPLKREFLLEAATFTAHRYRFNYQFLYHFIFKVTYSLFLDMYNAVIALYLGLVILQFGIAMMGCDTPCFEFLVPHHYLTTQQHLWSCGPHCYATISGGTAPIYRVTHRYYRQLVVPFWRSIFLSTFFFTISMLVIPFHNSPHHSAKKTIVAVASATCCKHVIPCGSIRHSKNYLWCHCQHASALTIN